MLKKPEVDIDIGVYLSHDPVVRPVLWLSEVLRLCQGRGLRGVVSLVTVVTVHAVVVRVRPVVRHVVCKDSFD